MCISVTVFNSPLEMSCGVSQSIRTASFAFPFYGKTNGPRIREEPLTLRETEGQSEREKKREREREITLSCYSEAGWHIASLMGFSGEQFLTVLFHFPCFDMFIQGLFGHQKRSTADREKVEPNVGED